jgi:cellobiose phosphorylase
MPSSLYRFTSGNGSFRVDDPAQAGPVYFPLVNEAGLMSAITPDLAGDIKIDQHAFVTPPTAFEDLRQSRFTRNFWLSFKGASPNEPWSVSGHSVWQRAAASETVSYEAGFLWQRSTRRSRSRGIEASVLSFVPARLGAFEIMFVEVANISKKPVEFTATSAIPLYGRSADNLRDHRHVTSLLNRVTREKFGVSLCPTMSFNERGHLVNKIAYYVIGADDQGRAPAGVFATIESFAGRSGDLEKPASLVARQKAKVRLDASDQGKEAMGALQFQPVRLKPGATTCFTLLIGADREASDHAALIKAAAGRARVMELKQDTERYWDEKLSTITFSTGNAAFNQWVRWVQAQPTLRKLFGCSFLPDFDYGRGGRGWRDLWQDCLALLLQSPEDVRGDIIGNYGGVRIDGSNATIIGRKKTPAGWTTEFIADRNNIPRTWMDHGVWPFLTTLLYLNQTGDWDALRARVPYFQDALSHRAKKLHKDWKPNPSPELLNKLLDKNGRLVAGTVLEHVLVQTLVQFFNVGEHNMIRLEDADWNDGLDMAHARGESVAFTAMYAGNMRALADLLEMLDRKKGWSTVSLCEELLDLLDRAGVPVDYDSVEEKQQRLSKYLDRLEAGVSGTQSNVATARVVEDLRAKAAWIETELNTQEWIGAQGQSWYNGYYNNDGERVEGATKDGVRMTLSGQVYPLMAGLAPKERIDAVVKAVNKFLFDKKLGGVRLNTDFGSLQPNLGRAFSFAYGEKENGAVFSHMAVMYANALYQCGVASEGHRVLGSLFNMASDSARSRIFPGLPEYFNNEGQGRYMYLTGSASWYVLTLLTQVFGVRGVAGDLSLAPKLEPDQYDKNGVASVAVRFAGANVAVRYRNARRVPYEKCRIASVRCDGVDVPFQRVSGQEVVIARSWLSQKTDWDLSVELGV